jgi:hypothetical protein
MPGRCPQWHSRAMCTSCGPERSIIIRVDFSIATGHERACPVAFAAPYSVHAEMQLFTPDTHDILCSGLTSCSGFLQIGFCLLFAIFAGGRFCFLFGRRSLDEPSDEHPQCRTEQRPDYVDPDDRNAVAE